MVCDAYVSSSHGQYLLQACGHWNDQCAALQESSQVPVSLHQHRHISMSSLILALHVSANQSVKGQCTVQMLYSQYEGVVDDVTVISMVCQSLADCMHLRKDTSSACREHHAQHVCSGS